MVRKLFSVLTALLLTAGAVPTAWGALAGLGPSIDPHGYPAWYQDAGGLQLELCVPPPAGNATRTDLCIGDPIELDEEGNPVNPLVLTGESFWWMASTSLPVRGGGDAFIEFAMEGTFGGTEEPVDGQQISFGRTRIRIDTPVAGTYRIIHPYGTQDFVVVDPAEGINYTADIGAANFLSPEIGFRGALAAFGPEPVPFLTWPDFETNESLKVRGPSNPDTGELGPVLEQYVGDPSIASPVVGGPNGNTFRIEGPSGSNLDGQGNDFLESAVFFIMGKVFDPSVALVPHAFPGAPPKNLFAVGPVNRVEFFADPPPAAPLVAVTGVDYNYPVGYPLWYQEDIGTFEAPEGGLQLTLCTPGVMCISDPIDPTNEAQSTLLTGGESFYWSADAILEIGDDRYRLILGLEGTFGGDESLIDGQQISFGRERIFIDFKDRNKPAATYRITHPYGVRILSSDPNRLDRIHFTADIGIADPTDPDSAHVGTLYSTIGPTLLKWTTFNPDPTQTDPLLITPNANDPALFDYHVGHPGFSHQVVGSPFNTNFFRVEKLTGGTVENGTWQLVGETDLFVVSGKLFDEATFQFGATVADPDAPVANPDSVVLNVAVNSSVTMNILANDVFAPPATVALRTLPANGTAVINDPDGTVTYTPGVEFAAAGGTDIFSYSIVDSTGLASNITFVTVTVVPEGGPVTAPVSNPDSATLDMAVASSVTISVLTNDEFAPPATVTVSAQPANGTAIANNPAGTVTYTPNVALAASGGVDTFAYNIVDSTGLTSNNAVGTVTVVPAPLVESIAIRRARQLPNLRLQVQGTSNIEGSTLVIYLGTPDALGSELGRAVVRNGLWSVRGTATTRQTDITVRNLETGTIVTQPLQVR